MDWTEVIRQAEMIAAAPPPGYVNVSQKRLTTLEIFHEVH
jgi:hypothetical protein